MALNILNVVELGCQRVEDIDDDDLPVCLALVKESHDSENLDLLDLTDVANLFANLANIKGVVVALSLGLSVGGGRVFPGLDERLISRHQSCAMTATHLGERAVVPDVTVVGEAVANKAQLVLLDILLDGVERLLLGDLHLGVGPAGDLNDHVEDALVLVGEQRDVVEGGDDGAILFDEHAML